MPKQRKRKTRTVRKGKKDNLGIFLLFGFIAMLTLWYVVKDPLPLPGSGSETSRATQQETSESKAKTSAKAKNSQKKQATSSKTTSRKSVASLPNNAKKPDSQTKAEKHQVAAPVDLDRIIKATCAKLGIPERSYKHKKSGATTTYSIPIDRSNMDLTYANMIFKGELERVGGKLLKGTDSSGKQSLSFRAPTGKNTYTLNLYHDAKVFAGKQQKRSLAIVVDDFGTINGTLLDGFLALDKAVCFAIFPDEAYTALTAEKANAQGRETIIHVPMEPLGYPSVNPGKNAIFVHYSPSEIEHIINRFIKQLPQSRGINNHMGSLATTDAEVMRTVMTTLKKHNKYFLDSRTSNVSVAYATAQKAHIGAYRNDLFLDSPDISSATMDAKIKQIISLAETKSNIIAITHCHSDAKLQYLKKLISRLKAAGFSLVPLSEIGQYNVPGIL